MTSIYVFSEEQLSKLKLSDLRKLATYYGIEYVKHTPPKSLIKKIIAKQREIVEKESGIDEDDTNPKSVMVKRIEKYMREHNE